MKRLLRACKQRLDRAVLRVLRPSVYPVIIRDMRSPKEGFKCEIYDDFETARERYRQAQHDYDFRPRDCAMAGRGVLSEIPETI